MLDAPAVASRPSASLSLCGLALSLAPGFGPRRGRSLVEHLGNLRNVFNASLIELEAAGIREVSAQFWPSTAPSRWRTTQLALAATSGVSVVCLEDSSYPAELKQIYDLPLVL
jgi:predicted Rossmann fold nucleotide-binding protein DprA/Smf involved in DNA uptake